MNSAPKIFCETAVGFQVVFQHSLGE